jgi:hypothetical protein
MKRMCVSRSIQLLHISVLGLSIVPLLGTSPAAAQFVCDSTTPGGAAGALAGAAGFACGPNANATGANAHNTAVGDGADSRGNSASNTAVGFQAKAGAAAGLGEAAANTALGASASAVGHDSSNVAIGSAAAGQGLAAPIASGRRSSNFAVGAGANAGGDGGGGPVVTTFTTNIAIGFKANASGNADANGSPSSNLAMGTNATASNNSVAYGTGASATFSNSAAFGNGATATRANQQVFGTSANTYTLAGVASAASRAVQSGPTQFVTTDASGNLAAASAADLGIATTGDITSINTQLSQINARLNDLDGRTSKALTGVAMAFAMAGVPNLLPNERFAVTANFGTYEGRNGTAFNAAVRLTEQAQLTGGVAVGINDSVVGGRVGLRLGW